MMKYTIIISPKAKERIEEKVLFLTNVDKEAAISLKSKFIDSMKSLEEFPERYPFFNEEYIHTNKYHKVFIEKHYLMIYQMRDQIVYIDYLLDCRQNYSWLLKK